MSVQNDHLILSVEYWADGSFERGFILIWKIHRCSIVSLWFMLHKHIYIACQLTYRLFPVEAKCCNLLSLTHNSFCLEWLQGHQDALIYLCRNSLVFKHYPTLQLITNHVDWMNIFFNYIVFKARSQGGKFLSLGFALLQHVVWDHLQKYALKNSFSLNFHFRHQSVFSCEAHHPGLCL